MEAILDLPPPKSRQEVMRALGTCGFYRRFVPNFAVVTEPLTNLLKKDVRFVWTETCDRAFAGVKAILACEPLLLAPNFDAPFKLAVDAHVISAWGQRSYRWTLLAWTGQMLTTRKSLIKTSEGLFHHREGSFGSCFGH